MTLPVALAIWIDEDGTPIVLKGYNTLSEAANAPTEFKDSRVRVYKLIE